MAWTLFESHISKKRRKYQSSYKGQTLDRNTSINCGCFEDGKTVILALLIFLECINALLLQQHLRNSTSFSLFSFSKAFLISDTLNQNLIINKWLKFQNLSIHYFTLFKEILLFFILILHRTQVSVCVARLSL